MSDLLLLPAASFAAGIFLSARIGFTVPALLAGLPLLCLIWWFARRTASRSVACSAVFLVSGALTHELHRPPPVPELTDGSAEPLLVAGCIAEPVTTSQDALRFVVELEPGARIRTTLTLRPGERPPPLVYGQQVEFESRIRKPRNFGNPGAFDYTGWLARQDIFWTASVRGAGGVRVLPGECGTPVMRAAMRIREAAVQRIRQLFPPDGDLNVLLPALLVGENGMGDRAWMEGFRRTGTYHALVVSGLHIAVVAGALLFLMRVAGLPLLAALTLASFVAWGYAAVVNWQPPAVRSAAGFTLFLVARWFFRKGRVLNLLAAVLMAILAFDPAALFDASLQLTVLSVAAIGGLAAPLSERGPGLLARGLRGLARGSLDWKHPPRVAEFRIELRLLAETASLWTRVPLNHSIRALAALGGVVLWVAEAALLSACVQLALAVPLVVYFHGFSVTAIAANVIVTPALSAAVPVGLLACLTGLPPFVALTRWLVEFAQWATARFAALEPGWRVPDPPIWLGVLALLAVSWLALTLIGGRRHAIAGAILAGLAVSLLWIAPFPPDLRPDWLELTVIDVGQGDSLLLVTPGGQTILVDAGGIPTYGLRSKPALDPGEDVVSPYLWRRGLKRLDVVTISHLHEDHAGGIPAVIRNFRPSELWTGAVAPSPLWDEIRAAARVSGTRLRHLHAGDKPGLGVEVLAPSTAYEPGTAPHNHDSLVFVIRHGNRKFLLTGDAEASAETALRTHDIDVLKVAHHGSRNSTTDQFLGEARPLFAAVSAGADNSYGHPHPALLDRLRLNGVRLLRTDRDGLVTFRTDGHRIEVEVPMR